MNANLDLAYKAVDVLKQMAEHGPNSFKQWLYPSMPVRYNVNVHALTECGALAAEGYDEPRMIAHIVYIGRTQGQPTTEAAAAYVRSYEQTGLLADVDGAPLFSMQEG